MKKFVSLLLALVMVLALVACGGGSTTTEQPANTPSTSTDTPSTSTDTPAPAASTDTGAASGEGKVFNIYAWNEEFKGFFEKYYTVPDGVTVNWVIVPNTDGAYQKALDEALINQADAADDDKVDMFLAEADYIVKYTNSEATQDVKALGVTDFSQMYPYTVSTASDANGVVKGVSFQCCPAALIYRRSIAKDVLGTDDPDQVQAQLDSWEKYDAVAAQAKAKGYYMTASEAADFRVFSNNCTMPWVDANNKLQFSPEITAWMEQQENFAKNGYTVLSDVWKEDCTNQMFKDGKTMCFFGPAWYFNFCMTNAMDPDKGCYGDWAICEGPQSYFWGGTWLLAATGSDNPATLADVMKAFTVNEDICTKLVKEDAQFVNNKKVNEAIASDPNYGNDFLGGQNDTKFFCEHADNIKFENHTIYDQLCNEKLQEYYREYLKGSVDKDAAMQNFYKAIGENYPTIVLPQ